jgi:hypothetical protein
MPDEIPTNDEILKLPRWARVAFAARCARRVFPYFRDWKKADDKQVKAVEQAISLAENDASNGHVSAATARAADAADAAARAADADAAARAADAAAKAAAAAAGYAAGYAAAARAAAARAAASAASAARAAAAAAASAAAAAAYAAADAKSIRFIRSDYERLIQLSSRLHWTDETPVPPEVFDTLNSPVSESAFPDPIRGLILELYAKPDVPAKDVEDALFDIYDALNDLHMARGGGVLEVDKFRKMVNALVLDPAGV